MAIPASQPSDRDLPCTRSRCPCCVGGGSVPVGGPAAGRSELSDPATWLSGLGSPPPGRQTWLRSDALQRRTPWMSFNASILQQNRGIKSQERLTVECWLEAGSSCRQTPPAIILLSERGRGSSRAQIPFSGRAWDHREVRRRRYHQGLRGTPTGHSDGQLSARCC